MKKNTEMLMKAFISATKEMSESCLKMYDFRVKTNTTDKEGLSQKEAISLFKLIYGMSKGVDTISTLNSHHSEDMESITLTSSFFGSHKDGSPNILNTVSIEACMFMNI